jgi:hypothetical protein
MARERQCFCSDLVGDGALVKLAPRAARERGDWSFAPLRHDSLSSNSLDKTSTFLARARLLQRLIAMRRAS